MKTITRTIDVYTLDELSKEAQEKAHMAWIESLAYEWLPSEMEGRARELIKENGIELSLTDDHTFRVFYSLANCQGDGAMFEGRFTWKGYIVTIKQSGHYYHYNSKNIDIETEDEDGYSHYVTDEKVHEEFNDLYVSICKELERYGYDYIEDEQHFENFQDVCESNEWTFTKDGQIEIE